ncbi:MAG: NAD(P)H:quinone oxidoreductase [Bacillota bacterium]|nr:NAD(P)H:quinone oxidoreductase [Bacillota bacterium]
MRAIRLAIVYYSSTGTIYRLARAAESAALEEGAEVRLRKVRELAPDAAVDANPAWRAHVEATRDVPEAGYDDLEWADAYLFGTPTRFGNVASQMKQFIDTTGPLWAKGKLADKVAAGFTSASNDHGGQESTLLALYNVFHHWGCILVPPGYTGQPVFAAGGNPYGVSVTARPDQPVPEAALEAARYLTRRLLRVAGWLLAGREAQA